MKPRPMGRLLGVAAHLVVAAIFLKPTAPLLGQVNMAGTRLLVLPIHGSRSGLHSRILGRWDLFIENLLPVELHETALDPFWADPYQSLQFAESLAKTENTQTMRNMLNKFSERQGAEGILAYWIERNQDSGYTMVSLLYLPERIKLQSLAVSVNLEREDLDLGKGEEILTRLTRRNLTRIVEKDQGVEPLNKDPEVALKRDLVLGVLDFSRELIDSEEEVRKTFGSWLLRYDFMKEAEAALKRLRTFVRKVVPMESLVIGYDQIQVPRHGASGKDSTKLEESLARYCERHCADDIEGLIFGQLYQRSDRDLEIHVHFFYREGLRLFSHARTWPDNARSSDLDRELYVMLHQLFRTAQGGEPFLLIIPRGGELNKIAERCYAVKDNEERAIIVRKLAEANNIWNIDRIREGELLMLPDQVDGLQRTLETCHFRRN